MPGIISDQELKQLSVPLPAELAAHTLQSDAWLGLVAFVAWCQVLCAISNPVIDDRGADWGLQVLELWRASTAESAQEATAWPSTRHAPLTWLLQSRLLQFLPSHLLTTYYLLSWLGILLTLLVWLWWWEDDGQPRWSWLTALVFLLHPWVFRSTLRLGTEMWSVLFMVCGMWGLGGSVVYRGYRRAWAWGLNMFAWPLFWTEVGWLSVWWFVITWVALVPSWLLTRKHDAGLTLPRLLSGPSCSLMVWLLLAWWYGEPIPLGASVAEEPSANHRKAAAQETMPLSPGKLSADAPPSERLESSTGSWPGCVMGWWCVGAWSWLRFWRRPAQATTRWLGDLCLLGSLAGGLLWWLGDRGPTAPHAVRELCWMVPVSGTVAWGLDALMRRQLPTLVMVLLLVGQLCVITQPIWPLACVMGLLIALVLAVSWRRSLTIGGWTWSAQETLLKGATWVTWWLLFVGLIYGWKQEWSPSTARSLWMRLHDHLYSIGPQIDRITVMTGTRPEPSELRFILQAHWPRTAYVSRSGWDPVLTDLLRREQTQPRSRILLVTWDRGDLRVRADLGSGWQVHTLLAAEPYRGRRLALMLLSPWGIPLHRS
ncbi:MAG: hypothetical protein KatS3mg114_0301 [Planctomycetaceae bacterium]|nr:MAG: hypothetical protein KatS3mg114_0301 [Planctomycetaceae bacterium]